MASLILSMASSSVSPWLWQPGSTGQWTSKPYSDSFITTVYFIFQIYHYMRLVVKKTGYRRQVDNYRGIYISHGVLFRHHKDNLTGLSGLTALHI